MTSTENIKDPLVLKAINEILDKNFFIPDYQRGYRWTKQQVEDLLNDIDSFVPKQLPGEGDDETFYCLQPIALKLCNEQQKIDNNLQGEWYEVIDGQQRLTTLYLIMHYANEMWTGKQKNPEITIKYETRNNCVTVLKGIEVGEDEKVEINSEYIDYFYITTAYSIIHNWVSTYAERKKKPFDENKFKSKFNTNTQIIWYEVSQKEKSTKLFERLNIGKIPLTNAELIKALFLNATSFPELSAEEQNVKRLEIAKLWDDIEHKLNERDAKFWSFITNKKRTLFATKIELILDMIAHKSEDEKDPLATFLAFSKLQKEVGLSDVWMNIEHYYLTLKEWYADKDLYHKVGYLIASRSKVDIPNLIEKSGQCTKTEFDSYLKEKIAETVNFEITELRYESQPAQIHNVLLLFNVETIRTSDAITEFYPFKQHKDNLWSIEHIHARNSEDFDQVKKEPWIKWLDMHEPILEELSKQEGNDKETILSILQDVKQYNNKHLTWERFSEIFKSVNNVFIAGDNSIDLESEGIYNLALLSQPDNAALNNAVFEVKRREIIRLDKEGSFIPICTRRLFLKYYNDDDLNQQFYYWTKSDRRNYYEALRETIKEYLPSPKTVQNED